MARYPDKIPLTEWGTFPLIATYEREDGKKLYSEVQIAVFPVEQTTEMTQTWDRINQGGRSTVTRTCKSDFFIAFYKQWGSGSNAYQIYGYVANPSNSAIKINCVNNSGTTSVMTVSSGIQRLALGTTPRTGELIVTGSAEIYGSKSEAYAAAEEYIEQHRN